MKHLFICLLAVLLTACSDSSTNNSDSLTSGSPTSLVEMSKYEILNSEELQELEIEYMTYAEMYEEGIDDWLFDMDKNVMEDDAIVGYDVSFPDRSEDEPGIDFTDFGDFLRFAFGTDEKLDMEVVDEGYSSYSAEINISDSSDGNKYLVYFTGDYSDEGGYLGVNHAEMYITD